VIFNQERDMDREYVNEQVREGLTETVLHFRPELPGLPQTELIPIDDLLARVAAVGRETTERLKLAPGRFTSAVTNELARTICAQLEMAARPGELSLIALDKEAQALSENIVKACQDADRVATTLGKLANATYEDYFDLQQSVADPALTESLLTTPDRGRFTGVARGGQPIEPVKLPFTSLPSSKMHRITATVGAVDDFRDTAALRILTIPRARSRALEILLGDRVPLSFTRKQIDERRMLLTAQSSGSDIALQVTARLGIGVANSRHHQLKLMNVLPLVEQSARFRTAHETVQPMFEQLALFDRAQSDR
jgi:hypothetical protein